ncbi:aldehyde dehydrogenase family protein [Aestuariimicrobium sp. T2.26MG-19.2B]|uniref:aldehyde dehydrogenase family protein n=1 Tax=Aestuariimicrobium sp. T2.26MG-19.2B TaxID=3040679 RepID=UPI00247738F6|nr:aldehyde dehydrogenase family protein [Aestuariimicrobium sp. T2.26MG-19.2B]CAI9409632.1 Succinate-semialdehyde dehydrogenase [NADP(+)] [Aestuariimicrobium sp. T2.26MG-19.2B]
MTSHDDLVDRARRALTAVGVSLPEMSDSPMSARSPISGTDLFPLPPGGDPAAEIGRASAAFSGWREVPAPVRGRVVKRLGRLISEHQEHLADLVTIEAGKIRSEALGEVQEMVDICDLAVGLSRQLFGRTMPSERVGHRLQETWYPVGVVGVISAFNFPVAVWSWNTAVALVCGNTVVWKPSELTSLCALACSALVERALVEEGHSPDVHRLLLGDRSVGELLVDDPRVALVSATGSTRMGQQVGPRVAARFGRSLLELGGNNAVIVTASADLDLAVSSMVFAAAGTAGQRCTTQRRLLVHNSVADEVCRRLERAFASLPVGDPFDEHTLVGPLINEHAADQMSSALEAARNQGGAVTGGERVDTGMGGVWVRPALVRLPEQTGVVLTETFAPILYVLTWDALDEAITLHNAVPQGLSGGIFTRDQAEAERYLAAADTGIANVNVATSGAEIGGAFGGEKQTGGGRESGSDAWRGYMRRQTATINYSGHVALAQGVDFG